MERLREIKIQVEIDTNKATSTETFSLEDYTTLGDLLDAMQVWIDEHTRGT